MASPAVHLIAGTRPEAIKVAPLALAMRERQRLRPVLVDTGQHSDAVSGIWHAFGLEPSIRLPIVRTTGTLAEYASALISAYDPCLTPAPAAVVVQGDTITAHLAGLSAFWRQIPVVHLEAGLRSGDLTAPFPEEASRRQIAQFAALHLAPTRMAAENLHTASVGTSTIVVTGNTVVDAIRHAADRGATISDPTAAKFLRSIPHGGRAVLCTIHRRESWGSGIHHVLQALRQLTSEEPDVHLLVATHPNPDVALQVSAQLAGHQRITVTGPLSYGDMAQVLKAVRLILTDSGGLQEEAPTFETPVIVLRDVTERTEAVATGHAYLAGTDPERILKYARHLLASDRPAAGNPFGDGHAASRCEQAIAWYLGLAGRPAEFGSPNPQTRAYALGSTGAACS